MYNTLLGLMNNVDMPSQWCRLIWWIHMLVLNNVKDHEFHILFQLFHFIADNFFIANYFSGSYLDGEVVSETFLDKFHTILIQVIFRESIVVSCLSYLNSIILIKSNYPILYYFCIILYHNFLWPIYDIFSKFCHHQVSVYLKS